MGTVVTSRELRCFLEGIEFPFVSMKGIVQKVFGPLRAQVQIVCAGDPRFLGNTYVLVMLYDSLECPDGIPLFEGEMKGYTYVSTGGGGTCVLQCQSVDSAQNMMLINMLTQKIETEKNPLGDRDEELKTTPTTVGERYASFSGGVIISEYETVKNALFSSPVTSELNGVLGGLVHLMEVFTGIQRGKNQTQPVDTYIGLVEYRLRLLQRIMAPAEDRTIEKMMKLSTTKKWLDKILKGIRGNQPLSFGQLKGEILNRLHYQSLVSCMSKYTGSHDVMKSVPVYGKGMLGKDKAGFDSVLSWMNALKTQVKKFSVSKTFLSWDPSGFLEGALFNKAVACPAIRFATEQYIKGASSTYVGVTDNAQSQKLKNQRKSQSELVKNYGRDASSKIGWVSDELIRWTKTLPYSDSDKKDLFMGLYYQKLVDMVPEIDSAIANLTKWIGIVGHGAQIGSTKRSVLVMSRYNHEIMIPDLWFAMPPACNLILESMYSQLTITRSQAAEPSRLLLMGPKVGFEGVYLRSHGQTMVVAPNLRGEVGKTILEDTIKGKYTLLPHEKYMGPAPVVIPITQALGLSEFETSGGESDSDEYFGIGLGVPPALQEFLDKAPLNRNFPFLQRVAHATFMSQYFGARRATISGPFFPRLIAGLPAVVEHRRAFGDSKDDLDLYVGNIFQIDVSATSKTANMTVHMSHIRASDEWRDIAVYMRMYKKDPYAEAAAAWKAGQNKLMDAINKVNAKGGENVQAEPWEKTTLNVTLDEISKDSEVKLAKAKTDAQKTLYTKMQRLSYEIKQRTQDMTKYEEQMLNLRGSDLERASIEASRINTSCSTPEADMPMEVFGGPTTLDKPAVSGIAAAKGTVLERWDHANAKFIEATEELVNLMGVGGSAVTMSEQKTTIEDLCRPPWLDPMYNDNSIGEKLYQPLWGVPSMQDLVVIEPVMNAEDYSFTDYVDAYVRGIKDLADSRLLRKSIISAKDMFSFTENATIPGRAAGTGEIPQSEFTAAASATDSDQDIDPRPSRGARVDYVYQRLMNTSPHTTPPVAVPVGNTEVEQKG